MLSPCKRQRPEPESAPAAVIPALGGYETGSSFDQALHSGTQVPISTQVIPLHTGPPAYGCSLPRLTGFTGVPLSGAQASKTGPPESDP